MSATQTRRRRPLTPEQLTAAKERRETITRLARAIGKMSEDERLTMASRLPVVTCEGHSLSPFNCCLIASQQPDATVVGGFQQWQREGRQVRKGGKGCAIFVPKVPKESEGEAQAVMDERRFLMITVFDITMTDAIEQAEG